MSGYFFRLEMKNFELLDFMVSRIRQAAFNQKEAARKMGISQAYLSDVLQGRRKISVEFALAFERLTRYEAEQLLIKQVIFEVEQARLGNENKDYQDEDA